MTRRDEYVERLKAQLDEWNAEAAHWEEKVRQTESGMKAEFERQFETFRARRDEAMYTLHQLQVASAEAWTDMMRGADEAWKRMGDAFSQARSHFDRKP